MSHKSHSKRTVLNYKRPRKHHVNGAVAKLGGEPRRPSFSFPDGRCVPAFSGRLEDPVDDHRVRIGVPISKHRALTFP